MDSFAFLGTDKKSALKNIPLLGALVSMLLMFMVPLPPLLIDFLFSLTILGSVLILIMAVLISDPLQISSFPSIILVATLFRLGLTISATRLILTEGFAGHLIQSFGNIAMGGKPFVGFLLFIILTIILFLVMAKGSERVAEVAARFTLDALPGKQMSIDADLRAGLINQETARMMRNELHRESRFYGSLDGAMKFVKGDAIASLIIMIINLLGGMGVGILSRGFSFSEALGTYALLTMGEGLINQIPALLFSLSAGLIITRVVNPKNPLSLGQEIQDQLLTNPFLLLIVGAFSFLFCLIPGFPWGFFFILGILLISGGFISLQQQKQKILTPLPIEKHVLPHFQSKKNWEHPHPLIMEVSPELYQIFTLDLRWTRCFSILYPKMKYYLEIQSGFPLPTVKLKIENLKTPSHYRIRIYNLIVDEGSLDPHHALTFKQPLQMPENITIQNGETFHGSKVLLWEMGQKKDLSEKGIHSLDPEEVLLRHLGKILKKHGSEFLGIQEVRSLLQETEKNFPELVNEIIPRLMSLQKFTEILKRLVEERVPIGNLRLILEILSSLQPESKDPVTLTEQVRMGMKRLMTSLASHDGKRISALLLSPTIEEMIHRGIQRNGSESYLILPPEQVQNILNAFEKTLQLILPNTRVVLLTQASLRRYVRKLIESSHPELMVFSFQECDEHCIIQQIGEVQMPDDEGIYSNPSQ